MDVFHLFLFEGFPKSKHQLARLNNTKCSPTVELVEVAGEGGDELHVLAAVVELHVGDGGGEEGPGVGRHRPHHRPLGSRWRRRRGWRIRGRKEY